MDKLSDKYAETVFSFKVLNIVRNKNNTVVSVYHKSNMTPITVSSIELDNLIKSLSTEKRTFLKIPIRVITRFVYHLLKYKN